MRLHQVFKFLVKAIIVPHSANKDIARREFILNILLTGLVVLTAIGLIINVLHPFLYPSSEGQNPVLTGSILFFMVLLLAIARSGKSQLSSQIFIWFLFLVGLYMTYYWGADLPAVLLFFSLLIVMAGILINSKFAFIVAFLSGAIIIAFSYTEIFQIYKPHIQWKKEIIHMVDSVVYVIILVIIAVVSWLSNRELEKSLRRARNSEKAVKRQRDNLEVLVEKRTRELRQVQAEKLSQLYRFAEFGRMSTGLFHDLANPLTLVSLNLDRLRRQSKNMDLQKITDTKILLRRAISGTHRLEKFILAARKQVQHHDVTQLFSMKEEVSQAIQLLDYKARKRHVILERKIPKNIIFYGNSVKFNQLITNLLSNAIDSYAEVTKRDKKVELRLYKIGNKVHLEVQDWGSGIDNKDIPLIFEPLFTTKPIEKGMGLGLSICRDIVEKYLKGKMSVVSEKHFGTTFIVTFPIKKSPKK